MRETRSVSVPERENNHVSACVRERRERDESEKSEREARVREREQERVREREQPRVSVLERELLQRPSWYFSTSEAVKQ